MTIPTNLNTLREGNTTEVPFHLECYVLDALQTKMRTKYWGGDGSVPGPLLIDIMILGYRIHWALKAETPFGPSMFKNYKYSSNKYKEKAFEAMSRAVDKITNVDESEYEEMEYGFGPVLFAFEKGFEEDADKQIVTLTEHVLRNCGHHAVAEAFNKKMRMDLKDRISQMNENYNPTDEI